MNVYMHVNEVIWLLVVYRALVEDIILYFNIYIYIYIYIYMNCSIDI